ncbi:uncharacterized protein LOC141612089 [Silene latifolia]|uniref:uncharacterized protein LOC141612089 n=1 Tax=Silene latifolia TaxID=37657 RepID=UPI003D776DDF
MQGAMGENSVSSCWRGEHSKSDEKWILVCSNNDKLEDELGNGLTIEGGRRYQRAEFHMVDLNNKKIHRHCFPSLVQFVVTDSMVAFDNFVYIFGYRSSYVVDSSDFKKLQSQQSLSPETLQEIFLGGSRLDLDQSLHTGWCPTPVPSENACLPKCTSLLGKIYTFGTLYLNPEVFDPVDGNWKSLPSRLELVGCTVSNHVLPDPSKKRFLVHLSDGQLPSPSLFAFFPPGLHPADFGGTGIWDCIARDFEDWTHIAVVFDGVIYFHSRKFDSVLRAFDIATGTWLEVLWVSCFDDNLDLNNKRMEFDALLLLADGIFCLAAWSPIFAYDGQPTRTNIYFYKFNVVRSGETIKLCPLTSCTYELLSTSRVQVFLPV